MKHAADVTSSVKGDTTAYAVEPSFQSVDRFRQRSIENVTRRRCWLRIRPASPIASLVTLVMALSAVAEPEGDRLDDELSRWQFSAGAEFAFYGTGGEGEISGTTFTGPRATNINPLIGDEGPTVVPELSDSQRVLSSGLLGGTFGVMTPALFDIPTHPRLFLDVSILPAITLETSVVRDGDPGPFRLPEDIPPSPAFVPERLVLGSGTNLTSQHQGVQFRAGLGMAFTILDFDEGYVRIKPSLHYARIENKVSAITRRAVRTLNADPFVVNDEGRTVRFRSLDHFRFVDVNDEFTEVYHAVGPSFEIEFVTQEAFGPFGVSLFLKTTATAILGDRETEFLVANSEFEDETASYRFKNDPWSYTAAIGIRLLFSPDLNFLR